MMSMKDYKIKKQKCLQNEKDYEKLYEMSGTLQILFEKFYKMSVAFDIDSLVRENNFDLSITLQEMYLRLWFVFCKYLLAEAYFCLEGYRFFPIYHFNLEQFPSPDCLLIRAKRSNSISYEIEDKKKISKICVQYLKDSDVDTSNKVDILDGEIGNIKSTLFKLIKDKCQLFNQHKKSLLKNGNKIRYILLYNY